MAAPLVGVGAGAGAAAVPWVAAGMAALALLGQMKKPPSTTGRHTHVMQNSNMYDDLFKLGNLYKSTQPLNANNLDNLSGMSAMNVNNLAKMQGVTPTLNEQAYREYLLGGGSINNMNDEAFRRFLQLGGR